MDNQTSTKAPEDLKVGKGDADKTRDHLTTEVIFSLMFANIRGDKKALLKSEGAMKTLADHDGGRGSQPFKEDLKYIDRCIHKNSNYLPFLELAGLDDASHILVKDHADEQIEKLIIDRDGMITPDAPPDSTVHHQLYRKLDGEKSGIGAKFVQQGKLSDCYFLSVLQGLSEKNPNYVRSLIKDNGEQSDGSHSFTVRFPGRQPVTVQEPSIFETTAFAHDAGGLWVNVLEKAHRKVTGKILEDHGEDASEMSGFKFLTGENNPRFLYTIEDSVIRPYSPVTPARSPMMMINDKDLVSDAGTISKRDIVITDTKGHAVKLIGEHSYALISYDDKAKTVTVANPYGYNEAVKPADTDVSQPLISMKLEDFKRNFVSIGFSQIPVTKSK